MARELLPPDQWQRVKSLFDEVAQLPPPVRAERVATDEDPVVRAEVLALLEVHEAAGGFLEPATDRRLEAGHRLGPYEVRGHLGAGGMGDVYRAHDTRLDRDVAVKVLRGALADDAARARFEREARAIAALSHANVVAIFDVGTAAGLPYIVTELLEGETLRARLRRDPPPLARALDIAAQIARGLGAAHDAGIIHRDLKPENVILLPDGRVKLVDFGLARALPGARRPDDRVTAPGLIVGTAAYLAPEQARGQPLSTAADLFALGAILHELLTGARAFRGATLVDTLRAVVEHEPPPPSTVGPGVPRWLDTVVARCLAKDVASRFQSARDLAFVLGAPPGPAPATTPRRWPVLAACVALGAAGVVGLWPRPRHEPPLPAPLTSSGRDTAPAVSHDGRFLAFASDRDGRARIWLQQLDSGRDTTLTDGPDDAPRFAPDDRELLFTRTEAGGTALYRVGLLGGDARRIADDAADGDWSPDGRQVVFVRWRETMQARPLIMVAAVDGSGERELAHLEYRGQIRPRWSPDGKTIAVTGTIRQPGSPQTVLLIPLDGSAPRSLPTPGRVGFVSAVAWDGPDALLYSQAVSVTGNISGSAARLVRHRLDDGSTTTLLWSPESSLVVDRWPGRGVVFDARSPRENLRETIGGDTRILSRGTATDRQPVYAHDGEHVIFSSNRGGANLDVWAVHRTTGATRRLTDDPADDWDPALTADGRALLWSSNRSGNYEVWMADADGAHPRQVTHDGVDAENPTATPDARWIAFSSGAPGRSGVWRVRPDGSDAALLVPGVILPEVSPDGSYVLFQTNRSPRAAVVGVATLVDGKVLPFQIHIDVRRPTLAILGRARWMPDGHAIAFIGQDEHGVNGVYVQRFAVDEDTSATRVPLAGFDPEHLTESFAVAPTLGAVVLAEWEQRTEIMAATGFDP